MPPRLQSLPRLPGALAALFNLYMTTSTAPKSAPKSAKSAQPAYRAYTVIKHDGKDDKQGYWLNIGVAFAHEDSGGSNLLLQALPIDGKIVLRTYKESEHADAKGRQVN